MSAEARRWKCGVCETDQETIDRPRSMVCDDCFRSVASPLCKRELGHDLSTPGVDDDYWMRQASGLLLGLVERVRMGGQRRSAADAAGREFGATTHAE